MLLKDRVMLITNVEKFAGHGTTEVALAQGATVLAHDPSFQEPSARRKYESHYTGAHALSAVEPESAVTGGPEQIPEQPTATPQQAPSLT